jgi:hypothetical protein
MALVNSSNKDLFISVDVIVLLQFAYVVFEEILALRIGWKGEDIFLSVDWEASLHRLILLHQLVDSVWTHCALFGAHEIGLNRGLRCQVVTPYPPRALKVGIVRYRLKRICISWSLEWSRWLHLPLWI